MEFTTELGEKKLIVKIGELAKHANGSCVVQYGETTVLATAVMGKEEKELDYFPLSVEYEERFYAAGKIKGSRFIKRETRPPDEAILAARFVDRSIRPLFNTDLRKSVQVVLTVLSVDQKNDPDIVALYAACVALSISDIPWNGPVAGVRICSLSENKKWAINPIHEYRDESDLDLVICGKNSRVLMVEAEGKNVNDEIVFEGVKYGIEYFEKVNKFILDIQKKVGKEKMPIVADLTTDDAISKAEVKKITEDVINSIAPKYLFKKILITKQDRSIVVEKIKAELDTILIEKQIGKDKRTKAIEYANKLIYNQVSKKILDDNTRIDGRKLDEIRPVSCQVGILPRVHGSALFSRGETQTLSVITLGPPGMEQYLETMEETGTKRFMHHYNFPPFCTGETRPMRSTSRREIGHGSLVEKGLIPIVPNEEAFPYTVRIVSEILSSNGSSSMSSACASVLAAMDAGMPIKYPVAGIAIGLASEEDEKGFKRYKIITDIQDLEDGPGGMDFKTIGTANGVTSIQMDTKTQGLTLDIIKHTLAAASTARAEVINKMAKVIEKPRESLSVHAPKVVMFKINPDKIRDVIGPGGKIINEIINKTGAMLDIEQDGTVYVTSVDDESLNKAVQWVKDLTREFEVGEVFDAKVARIVDFGIFVELVPGQDGLVHISKMSHKRIKHPSDLVKEGDVVKVKIISIDGQGKIALSMNAFDK